MKTRINYNYGLNPYSEIWIKDERFKKQKWSSKSDERINRRKKPTRGMGIVNKIKLVFCVTLLISTWYMCYTNNQPKAQTPIVEAEESAPSPLTKEQGFTQVAPREITARESTEQLIERYFGKDAKTALAIAKAESGLNPTALGDINTKYPSAGVFQIRLLPERGITKEQMFNVEHNIEYAKMLYDKYGFSPWTCYGNGAYLKFLNK